MTILGSTTPRIFTEPLDGRRRGQGPSHGCPCGCALSPETSRGFEVVDWPDEVGLRDPEGQLVVLRPWQRWLLIHALERDEACERLRFRTVLVLVSRQNGKTLINAVLSLWHMYVNGSRYLVGTAQDLSLAWEVVTETLVPMIQNTPALRGRFDPDAELPEDRVGRLHQTLNDRYFRLDSRWLRGRAVGPHGPRYVIKSLNRKAGRGLAGVSVVNIDELREQWDFQGWSAVSNVVLTIEDAQVWCMSNAGDAKSVLLKHLRGLALGGTEPSLFHAEWSAPDGCDQEDPGALAQANPSLGFGLTMEALLASVRQNPLARVENLCQFVDVLNTALDMDAWAASADPMGVMPDGVAPALCVDAATEGPQVVAVACAETPGGRHRLDVVGVWDSTDKARVALPQLKDDLRPASVGWFPKGPGAALGEAMRKLGAVEVKGAAVTEACMTFADRVDGRRVLHPDDPLLNSHARHTGTVGSASSWAFDRGPGATHAVWAAAGALHLALNQPEAPEPEVDPFVLT